MKQRMLKKSVYILCYDSFLKADTNSKKVRETFYESVTIKSSATTYFGVQKRNTVIRVHLVFHDGSWSAHRNPYLSIPPKKKKPEEKNINYNLFSYI